MHIESSLIYLFVCIGCIYCGHQYRELELCGALIWRGPALGLCKPSTGHCKPPVISSEQTVLVLTAYLHKRLLPPPLPRPAQSRIHAHGAGKLRRRRCYCLFKFTQEPLKEPQGPLVRLPTLKTSKSLKIHECRPARGSFSPSGNALRAGFCGPFHACVFVWKVNFAPVRGSVRGGVGGGTTQEPGLRRAHNRGDGLLIGDACFDAKWTRWCCDMLLLRLWDCQVPLRRHRHGDGRRKTRRCFKSSRGRWWKSQSPRSSRSCFH